MQVPIPLLALTLLELLQPLHLPLTIYHLTSWPTSTPDLTEAGRDGYGVRWVRAIKDCLEICLPTVSTAGRRYMTMRVIALASTQGRAGNSTAGFRITVYRTTTSVPSGWAMTAQAIR